MDVEEFFRKHPSSRRTVVHGREGGTVHEPASVRIGPSDNDCIGQPVSGYGGKLKQPRSCHRGVECEESDEGMPQLCSDRFVSRYGNIERGKVKSTSPKSHRPIRNKVKRGNEEQARFPDSFYGEWEEDQHKQVLEKLQERGRRNSSMWKKPKWGCLQQLQKTLTLESDEEQVHLKRDTAHGNPVKCSTYNVSAYPDYRTPASLCSDEDSDITHYQTNSKRGSQSYFYDRDTCAASGGARKASTKPKRKGHKRNLAIPADTVQEDEYGAARKSKTCHLKFHSNSVTHRALGTQSPQDAKYLEQYIHSRSSREVSPVSSPRFGCSDSPQNSPRVQAVSLEPMRDFPVYEDVRAGNRNRDTSAADAFLREFASASQATGAPKSPRRRILQTLNSPDYEDDLVEASYQQRQALRQRLDRGLEEALAEDMRSFQLEAFGFKNSKAAQQCLPQQESNSDRVDACTAADGHYLQFPVASQEEGEPPERRDEDEAQAPTEESADQQDALDLFQNSEFQAPRESTSQPLIPASKHGEQALIGKDEETGLRPLQTTASEAEDVNSASNAPSSPHSYFEEQLTASESAQTDAVDQHSENISAASSCDIDHAGSNEELEDQHLPPASTDAETEDVCSKEEAHPSFPPPPQPSVSDARDFLQSVSDVSAQQNVHSASAAAAAAAAATAALLGGVASCEQQMATRSLAMAFAESAFLAPMLQAPTASSAMFGHQLPLLQRLQQQALSSEAMRLLLNSSYVEGTVGGNYSLPPLSFETGVSRGSSVAASHCSATDDGMSVSSDFQWWNCQAEEKFQKTSPPLDLCEPRKTDSQEESPESAVEEAPQLSGEKKKEDCFQEAAGTGSGDCHNELEGKQALDGECPLNETKDETGGPPKLPECAVAVPVYTDAEVQTAPEINTLTEVLLPAIAKGVQEDEPSAPSSEERRPENARESQQDERDEAHGMHAVQAVVCFKPEITRPLVKKAIIVQQPPLTPQNSPAAAASAKTVGKKVKGENIVASQSGTPSLISPRDKGTLRNLLQKRMQKAAAAAALSQRSKTHAETQPIQRPFQTIAVKKFASANKALPQPPKARSASVASRTLCCQNEAREAPSLHSSEIHEDVGSGRLTQRSPSDQMRPIQSTETFQHSQPKRMCEGCKRHSETLALKEASIKKFLTQLQNQDNEIQAHREFKKRQLLLQTETERHIDRLHEELEKLADENVELLRERKLLGETATKTAFRLLALHAQKQHEAPGDNQGLTEEHTRKQNEELQTLQAQLQELRQRVMRSVADEEQLKRMQEQLQKEQEECLSVKQKNQELLDQLHELQEQRRVEEEKAQNAAKERDSALQSERDARNEAETQLRETLDVMQLLKETLQSQQKQLEEARTQQQQLLQQQQHEQQRRLLLDALEAEAGGESLFSKTSKVAEEKNQSESKTQTQTTGVQAGPPLPYASHQSASHEAEERQEMQKKLLQQQRLVAKLRAALTEQTKASKQDKSYLQNLVLQLQQRIAELESYQHRLLLQLQQLQRMHLMRHVNATQQCSAPLKTTSFVMPPPVPLSVNSNDKLAPSKMRDDPNERQPQLSVSSLKTEERTALAIAKAPVAEDWLSLLAEAVQVDDLCATTAQEATRLSPKENCSSAERPPLSETSAKVSLSQNMTFPQPASLQTALSNSTENAGECKTKFEEPKEPPLAAQTAAAAALTQHVEGLVAREIKKLQESLDAKANSQANAASAEERLNQREDQAAYTPQQHLSLARQSSLATSNFESSFSPSRVSTVESVSLVTEDLRSQSLAQKKFDVSPPDHATAEAGFVRGDLHLEALARSNENAKTEKRITGSDDEIPRARQQVQLLRQELRRQGVLS